MTALTSQDRNQAGVEPATTKGGNTFCSITRHTDEVARAATTSQVESLPPAIDTASSARLGPSQTERSKRLEQLVRRCDPLDLAMLRVDLTRRG